MDLDKHPELFEVYFEHYKKLVYLAQTENEQWKQGCRASMLKILVLIMNIGWLEQEALDSVFEEIDIEQ